MSYETLETQLQGGLAVIWLNRPDQRNALNSVMIRELYDAVDAAMQDDAVKVVMLAGHGKVFCAGADLVQMQQAADASQPARQKSFGGLASVLRLLNQGPKPTVARVHGSAYAGGMGLVAACDVAIASTEAKFCLSEVKIGLIPAMISPYVLRAMGERSARRYFLSGEVFDAAEAYRIGLVQDIAQPDRFDEAMGVVVGNLLAGAPRALGECKQLIQDMVGRPIDDAVEADTAARLERLKVGEEAREGIAAFREKRKPRWVQ